MFGFRMDGACFVERARRAIPRKICPSQDDCPFGFRSTRSFRICKCDAYRLALSALEVTSVVLIRLDVNPNNVFLSDIDRASPVVKLGDLGNRT